MESSQSVLVSKTIRVILDIVAQKNGSNVVGLFSVAPFGYVAMGSTTNMVDFDILHTSTYTIDFNGVIFVDSIYMFIITNNDANAECKLQISGDGGATPFVDMTNEIGTGLDLITPGPGAWISNVSVGANKLQIRVLGRSTDGNNAIVWIRGDSFMDFTFRKELI